MPRKATRVRGWRIRVPKARWKRALLGVVAGFAVVLSAVLGYYYVQFSRIIEARLWPDGSDAGWPGMLHGQDKTLVRALRVAGIGRESAIELAVNAVLPVAFA